jgi:hypothetical protein
MKYLVGYIAAIITMALLIVLKLPISDFFN